MLKNRIFTEKFGFTDPKFTVRLPKIAWRLIKSGKNQSSENGRLAILS